MNKPDEFIFGGYFLVKQFARPNDISALLPAMLLTVSNCFTDVAPDEWAISGYNYEDSERAEEAAKFGIPSDAVQPLVRAC